METTQPLDNPPCQRSGGITERLTQGSINRSIWFLALPAMGSMVSRILFDLTHAFWISQAGATAMAALTAASFVVWAVYSLTHIVSTGITSIIARRMGELDEARARDVAHQSLCIASLIALLLSLVLVPAVPGLFALMQTPSAVQAAGIPYLMVFAVGAAILFWFVSIEAIFFGMGDTHTPMKLTIFSLVLNMVLDPLLIYGPGPLPAWGLTGAALATLLSRLAGVVIGVWVLGQSGWLSDRWRQFWPVDWGLCWQMLKIGTPHALSGILFCLVYMMLTPLIGSFGTEPLAALGIGHRIESLAFFSLMGFSVACTTLVGQNLGAGFPERAEKIVWRAFFMAAGLNFAVSILFLLGAKHILAAFSSDPAVIHYGSAYLQILAVALIFLALEVILEGAFGGAGDTVPPMIVVTLGTFLRLPLAYYMAYRLGMGAIGIWWAIALSTVCKGGALLIWFRLGHWKRKNV